MASFTNMATLSYSGGQINSNIVTGQLQEALTVTKTAVAPSYTIGETAAYVLTLVNAGTSALTGLSISDDLGAYTGGGGTVYPLRYEEGTLHYYVGGVAQATPTVTAGPPMTISGISVPAGGSAVLVYQTRVSAYASPEVEGEIRNTVTVSGGTLAAAQTAEAVTAARLAPQLAISKALSPSVVTENGQLTYTFTVQNFGNVAVSAGDNAVISDTFDPILRDIRVTYNGAAWTADTNYSYDETTGVFATAAGQLTVPEATYTQNADGSWAVDPGSVILTVSGTV